MRAVIVAVNYTEELALCLPYNRHHFESVHVITSSADEKNVRPVAESCNAEVIVTDLFYANGASFNKWAALEYGLDRIKREGVLAIMDADVLWPQRATIPFVFGNLYTPFRRMCDLVPDEVPAEHNWFNFPRHRIVNDFSGYTQVFHADDPHLGPAPWHQTDWIHAGGADTFFQAKWPNHLKIRPDWECLHVGRPATNWFGRASAFRDGSKPVESEERVSKLVTAMRKRRRHHDPEYRQERTGGA